MVHNIAPDPQIPPTNDSNGNVTEKSGVGAAVSIGLAIASVISNIYSTIHTNRQNRELAEKENQWNIEQWKRETGYNFTVCPNATIVVCWSQSFFNVSRWQFQ